MASKIATTDRNSDCNNAHGEDMLYVCAGRTGFEQECSGVSLFFVSETAGDVFSPV
jgi:hypothetical protein